VANFGWDDDDVRAWFTEIVAHVAKGDAGWIKSLPTQKYPPDTWSDYYEASIAGVGHMFIKFAVYRSRLIVTSFKEYDDAD
jgi:hypothetical protein